jgi:hypothetical protein
MGRNRTQQATPDLFSTTPVGEKTPPTRKQVSPAQEQRHILPKDLPTAVKHLTDSELELLITTLIEEAKRRGRLRPSAEQKARPVPKRSLTTNKQQVEGATVSLTVGQVNAVRAAFKAGIKPSVIARQFGISQSDVRKALASDTMTQRGT